MGLPDATGRARELFHHAMGFLGIAAGGTTAGWSSTPGIAELAPHFLENSLSRSTREENSSGIVLRESIERVRGDIEQRRKMVWRPLCWELYRHAPCLTLGEISWRLREFEIPFFDRASGQGKVRRVEVPAAHYISPIGSQPKRGF